MKMVSFIRLFLQLDSQNIQNYQIEVLLLYMQVFAQHKLQLYCYF